MAYTTEPEKISILRKNLRSLDNFKTGEKDFNNIDLLIQRIFDYFGVIPQNFKDLKELQNEITHFKNIKVYLEDISKLQDKIETVKNYPLKKKQLEKDLNRLSDKTRQYVQQMLIKEATETYEHSNKKIRIKYIANHYYLPLILSDEEKTEYITHIIKTKSETKFINDLEDCLSRSDNKFKEFEWWIFSKLDEHLDKIYIPYYNPKANKIGSFHPDFIFWAKKGNNYFIIFVDPKGTEHTDAYRKINGYKEIFEEQGKEKAFDYNGFKVKIKLFLKPEDVAYTLPEYKKYWFDNIDKMLEVVR